MTFFRKKDRELEKLGLSEDEVIDFAEEEKPEADIDKEFIYHITEGCPICGGDVKGNDHYRYFCKKCNIMFEKKDIMDDDAKRIRKTELTEDEKKELEKKLKELRQKVDKAFTDRPAETVEEVQAQIIPPHEPEEEPVDEEIPEDSEVVDEEPEVEAPEPEYELEEAGKIIASKESTKLHSGQCHFVKRIHPENRIYFETIADGEEQEYEMCVCLRRMKAKGEIE